LRSATIAKRADTAADAHDSTHGAARSNPLTDLGLTLPVFLGYHLGVVFLPVRNAADWVTRELVDLADHNLMLYAGLTLGIGATFFLVLKTLGRSSSLSFRELGLLALEGIAYAAAMRLVAGEVIGRLFLRADSVGWALAGFAGDVSSWLALENSSTFAGIVMSLGAGFYEELAFRVGLYGLGAQLLIKSLARSGRLKRVLVRVVWAIIAAAVFSAWHHVGALGEPFELKAFVFRWVCGLVFTVIYAFRGFAPAVWTHALYDMWVLVV
jgi:hypothetical protein